MRQDFRRLVVLRERVVRSFSARDDQRHPQRVAPGVADQLVVVARGFGDAVELGDVAFEAQFFHAETRHDGQHYHANQQQRTFLFLPDVKMIHPAGEAQRRNFWSAKRCRDGGGGSAVVTRLRRERRSYDLFLFWQRDDERQNQQRERRRGQHADRAEEAELLVAAHRRARQHDERGDDRQGTDERRRDEPPDDFAGVVAVGRRVVEVIDHVDAVVHRDAERHAREADGDGREMFIHQRQHRARDNRAEQRRQKRHHRQPPPPIRAETQHEHRGEREGETADRIAPDERGVVVRHPVAAGDGDMDAGEIFFNRVGHAQHFGHQHGALLGIRRGKIWFGHQQNVSSVAAGQSAVLDVRAAKTRLQRQHLGDHQRAHADGVGGDDILENHALRPGQLAADGGEIFADGICF